jgi:hypothetical protein
VLLPESLHVQPGFLLEIVKLLLGDDLPDAAYFFHYIERCNVWVVPHHLGSRLYVIINYCQIGLIGLPREQRACMVLAAS